MKQEDSECHKTIKAITKDQKKNEMKAKPMEF